MTNPTLRKSVFVLAVALFVVAGLGLLLAAPSQDVQASQLNQTTSENCSTCHGPIHELWSASKHGSGGLDCLVCHKLETGEGTHPFQLTFSTEPEELTCTVCHGEVTNDWKSSRHGEVGLQCVSCHNPHSQQQKPVEGNQTTCENCHKDQKGAMQDATHTQAGANCITCHLGTHRKHTFKADGDACATCHSDIHQANKLVVAGAEIRKAGDAPVPAPVATEPAHAEVETAQGGVNMPSWILLVAGILLGGGLMWVFVGRDPGKEA